MTSSKIRPGPIDYVAQAKAYAQRAVKDRDGKRYGEWIRLAAVRFLKDLKRAERKRSPPFYWSADQANRACGFIEELPHVEGTWATPEIRLDPSQMFFIVQLFGFRNLNGGRRFTTALFAIARKNAKSTLAAAILLYIMCCEPEQGPQIFAAATTGDQARIVWSVAKRMVEKTADIRAGFALETFANTIVRNTTSGTFKPINAKASTQDGLNPSALSFDELHAHKTHDLLNVLLSAAGARQNPLFLYTTTEGYETPGPWPETREFAKHVLRGVVEADHFLAIYYAVDDKDDDFDESKWIKANPLLESNPVLFDAIRKEAVEAKSMPGRLAEFRIKRLNRRASSASAWISLPHWNRCAGEVNLDELEGSPCWGAFDLAATTDMTAWRLLWLKDERWYTWGRCWVPGDTVKQKSERGGLSYQSWIANGFLTETEGNVTDYTIVERDILEDYKRFSPSVIPYDSWNAASLANNLISQGLPLVQFIQGPKSYHPGMQAFEREYMRGNFNHGGNPVLTWNAANLVPRRDVNSNLAPDRVRSAQKIDGMVALLMAFSAAQEAEGDYVTGSVRAL